MKQKKSKFQIEIEESAKRLEEIYKKYDIIGDFEKLQRSLK